MMASSALHDKLLLPEAAAILEDRLGFSSDDSRNRLERAIHTRSLREIVTFDSRGDILATDVTTWEKIDWDSGMVMIEPSWSGSPPTFVSVFPYLNRDELLQVFNIDVPPKEKMKRDRGGRLPRYDWEAFWIEVFRRVYEEGLPETRAELVRKMESWFANRGQEDIDKRTIEKRISKLFEALNRD